MTDAQQAGDSPRITVSVCSVWLGDQASVRPTLPIAGDRLRRRSVQFDLVVHFLNERSLLFKFRSKDINFFLLFSNCSMLFEEFIEQHRVHGFVANAVDFPFAIRDD